MIDLKLSTISDPTSHELLSFASIGTLTLRIEGTANFRESTFADLQQMRMIPQGHDLLQKISTHAPPGLLIRIIEATACTFTPHKDGFTEITLTRTPSYCHSKDDGFLSPPIVNLFHELVHFAHHLEEPELAFERFKRFCPIFDNEEEQVTILKTNQFQRSLGLPDRTNHYGSPPGNPITLRDAAARGHIYGIRELTPYLRREDLDLKTDGDTALMIAVRLGKVATTEALLNAGANPDLKDSSGRTALSQITYRESKEDLTDLLLCASVERSRYERTKMVSKSDECQVM